MNKTIGVFLALAICSVVFLTYGAEMSRAAWEPGYTRGSGGGGTEDPFVAHPDSVRHQQMDYIENVYDEESASLQKLINANTRFIGLELLTLTAGHPQDPASTSNAAIPGLTGLIASMYQHKPASTYTYLADILQSARIIPQAHAQGIGFSSLMPIMIAWQTFRDLAYFLFVLIFLVIGFMIMFRHKINSQVVVTVEQAVPNIIVALLFVTFSYAIAGLLIDIMYLVMYFIVGLFAQDADLINQNILQLGIRIMGEGAWSAEEGINNAIQEIVGGINLPRSIDWLTSLTLAIIVAIALLISIFKLFWELLKSYVTIILSVAFSPLILMAGAIPGKNTFGPWIKNLVGNLAVFPLVLLLLVMYKVIEESSLGAPEGGFMPPFLLGQGFGTGILPLLVAMGILIALPEIVKQVKEMSGAKDMLKIKEFAQAGWGRFERSTGPAGGVAGTTVGSGIGLVRGGIAGVRSYRGGTRGILNLGRDALHGYQEESGEADAEPVRRGGFLPSAGGGLRAGQKVGRVGQNIAGGIERALERSTKEPKEKGGEAKIDKIDETV